jgi:hypothetical protein
VNDLGVAEGDIFAVGVWRADQPDVFKRGRHVLRLGQDAMRVRP